MPDEERLDEHLMAAIARGGMNELGELFLRHQHYVLNLAYRILGRWDQAEDIRQEVFLRVHRAAGRYRPKAKFATWLHHIVVNLCRDEKRRGRQQPIFLSELSWPALSLSSSRLSETNGVHDLIQSMRLALVKLNARQRRAVVLHKIKGMSHKEIARRTGWSRPAIESLLVRAYRNLRKELGSTGSNGFEKKTVKRYQKQVVK